jgi:predicted MPP superfamily phosphohydrolase
MPNTLGMLGAMALMALLLTAGIYYILIRRITIFGGTLISKLLLLLISFFISLILLGMVATQFSDYKAFAIISSLGSRLLMLVLILTFLTGLEHLITTLINCTPLHIIGGRKRGILTLFLLLLILAYGTHQALTTTITETTIPTDKILKDVNIMLVADLHVDDLLSTIHLKELKKQIALQKPDLVLIAGDFFNRASVRQAQYYQVLSGLQVPIYAVEGNHDTMGTLEALEYIQEHTPIQFLYNESISLPEFNLQLVGIEEKGQWRNSTIDAVLQKSNIQQGETFNVLMTHQPIHLSKLEAFPIDLEIAGHTHRGQIWGVSYIVGRVNDYGYGAYPYHSTTYDTERTAFITQGIGTWGLPLRL